MATEEHDLYVLPCKTCGARAFLIRGFCATCAPNTHRDWNTGLANYEANAARYTAATGLEPLADWHAFEDWLDKNPPPPERSAP